MALLVAEKCGTLRLYNAMSGQPLMSMEVGQPGILLAADWCPVNSQLLVAAVGNHCYLWETARSSRPLDHKPLHSNGASELAFSYLQQEVCASRGHPGNSVKVFNFKTNQEAKAYKTYNFDTCTFYAFLPDVLVTQQVLLDVSLNVGRGLAWHPHCPVLAFGGDGRAHLFRVITC